METNTSSKLITDTIFKLAVIAILSFIGYQLSCYASNGRYATSVTKDGAVIITDTRTGESLFTGISKTKIHGRFGEEAYYGSFLFDHQAKLQEVRSKSNEETQEPSE
ncbi:MAG: hypothetical protein K9G46_03260 [Flavobacteriales bacterium]|nr:hypothetical protein [Flavobacteriales bacterium]